MTYILDMDSTQNIISFQVGLLICILLLLTWITVSDGVRISQNPTYIKARVPDTVVTLPCNFTTNTYDTPVITWFRYRGTERRRIMQFRDNTLTSYGELLSRVARGDRGALVLIRPTVGDSGKYSCEVEVDKEDPNFAMADMTLAVAYPDVTIKHSDQAVTATDSDSFVTLSCDFKTDKLVTPRITWSTVKGGEKNEIVTLYEDGGFSVDDQFVGRVARGDKGALVLISPTLTDSGTFICEVQKYEEKWVKSEVILSVTREKTNSETGHQHIGLIFLICILWISPVICGFLLEGKACNQIKNQCLQTMPVKQRITKGWRGILVLLALCLIFSGIACSTKALSIRDNAGFHYYKTVAYITGILGIIILCVLYIHVCIPLITIRKNCPRWKATPETNVDTPDTHLTTIQDTEATADDTEEPQGTEHDTDIKLDQTPHISQTINKNISFKMFKPTSEKVTGMVSTSENDIYLTTSSAIYNMDTTDNDYVYTCTKNYYGKEQLLMVSNFNNGIIVLSKSVDKGHTAAGNKVRYSLLPLSWNEEKIYNVSSKKAISCVQYGMEGDCVYIAFSDSNDVTKSSIHTNTGKISKIATLNTHVLDNPTFILQNSRGQIIISDSTKHDVFVFDQTNGFVTSLKISVPKDLEHELYGCDKLAIDTDDRIYVTGPNAKRVFVFGVDLRFERVIQAGTDNSGLISSITIHNNSLYVARSDYIWVYPLATTT